VIERQSSLLSFVRFIYKFSSVISLFVQCIKVKSILYYFYTFFDWVIFFCLMVVLDGNFAVGFGTRTDYP
jgi:hypothetical protein